MFLLLTFEQVNASWVAYFTDKKFSDLEFFLPISMSRKTTEMRPNISPIFVVDQGEKWKYQNNPRNLFKVCYLSGLFIVNFEQVSQIKLVYRLLTLNK